MTRPIAPGGVTSVPLTPNSQPRKLGMQWGDSALTAPTTPERRVAVVDRSQVDPTIIAAAEGMEGMFLDYMMKVMRETVPKNDMDLESPATEVYRSMLDSETAQKAVRAGGVGMADQIIAYLEAQRYTLEREHAAPTSKVAQQPQTARSTGGTHEGQPVGK